MAQRQYFGLSYPFTNNDFQNFFLDVNSTEKEKYRSQIMHVIFTPKGQRLRMPNFGTDLMRYIFQPNESESWKAIKNEITDAVQMYVDNVTLDDIQVATDADNPNTIFVRIDYSIIEGNSKTSDSIVTQI